MRRSLRYRYLGIAVTILVLAFAGCAKKDANKIKIPRLDPKYSYKDKEPMGGYVAYRYLNSMFDYGVTSVIKNSFSNLRYEINYNNTLYVIVAKSVFLSEDDVESMMNYVSNGNTLFISADYIDRKLTDTLSAKTSFNFMSFFAINEYQLPKKDTWVSLAHESPAAPNKYGFFFVPFSSNFIEYDSAGTQVLGYNEIGEPNFVAIGHGQGKFILHTSPAAFSNYFLLTGNNKEYLEKTFSYFDAATNAVYWDDYYRLRKGGSDNFSIAKFFRKYPPLNFAFWLVLALLLAFLAFGGKRRQRFVPEKMPNTNTTVSYTETIGRLYLQKKDNRNIAIKMFTYFLDQVRSTYYLNTQNLNDEFIESLSRKSGVAETKVKHLLELMEETGQSVRISDVKLLELHNLMQEYFKK